VGGAYASGSLGRMGELSCPFGNLTQKAFEHQIDFSNSL
jgi:hypothetical protein